MIPLNNTSGHFKAHHILVLRLQCPVDDQLDSGIKVLDRETVLVHVARACLQWAAQFRNSVLGKDIVARTLPIDPDKGQRQIQNVRMHSGRERVEILVRRESHLDFRLRPALQFARTLFAVGNGDLIAAQFPCTTCNVKRKGRCELSSVAVSHGHSVAPAQVQAGSRRTGLICCD